MLYLWYKDSFSSNSQDQTQKELQTPHIRKSMICAKAICGLAQERPYQAHFIFSEMPSAYQVPDRVVKR